MITFHCYPGYNTGQHMFVPASDECNRIHINIDTGSTTTTRFDHDDGGLLDLEAPPQKGWMIMKTMMIMKLANGDLLDQKAAAPPPGLTIMMTTMPLTRTMVMIAIMMAI